jgi:hypothetical protein
LFRNDAYYAMRSLLIGVLPMVAVLALLCGSFPMALALIYGSTVCTLGIGGFFWLGVAKLFGVLLQQLVPALRSKTLSGAAAADRRPGLDPPGPGGEKVVANLLVTYASEKLRQGASEDGVRRDLLWSGWSEVQTTAALEEARALLSAPPVTSSGRLGDAG